MKSEDIYDGITDIRDDLVDSASHEKSTRPRRRLWMGAIAAILALALLTGTLLLPGGGSLDVTAIALAEYPDTVPYPDESAYIDTKTGEYDSEGLSEAWDNWWNDVMARKTLSGNISSGYDSFVEKTARQFLSGSGDENAVCSPLSIYMALAMLAELTDGDGRSQILELLDCPELDSLRTQANSIWHANYIDDGAAACIPASSLWLSDKVSFRQDTMDILAEGYYASSYTGDTASDALASALKSWLNEHTGGLLREQVESIELGSDTILALATTLYFNARWDCEFSDSRNTTDVFHSPTGDVTAEYMNAKYVNNYCWGDSFSSICLTFAEGGGMSFILPDDGISIDELLSQDELYAYLANIYAWEKEKNLIVNMSIPKFDVSADLDLSSGLKEMGITAVFDPESDVFSPMTDNKNVFVSQLEHAARVMIDEEGCTAAAFTMIAAAGAGEPPDETVDFVLDRPFIFAITGDNGQILFMGVVNQPT